MNLSFNRKTAAPRFAFLGSCLAALLMFAVTPPAQAAAFTAGNIVVYRVGDGSASITSAATPVFLDEYTPAGTLVQSIAMPTTGTSGRLLAAGTATTEGFLSRSQDGKYLVVPGYDAAAGTATPNSSTTVPRVIGRVDASGAIDTSTSYVDSASAGNLRSAASVDGTRFWTSGSTQGARTIAFGATTATVISSSNANTRQIGVFGDQLYIGSGAGSLRMNTVGSGTPTTAGQTMTSLPGLPTATAAFNGFFFADLDGVAGVDTLYVCDETAGQIQKWTLNSGTWAMTGSVTLATARGLAGSVSVAGSVTTVTLFATSGASGTPVVTIADTTGWNGTFSGTTTTIVAGAGTNKAFRGVVLAPTGGAPSPTNPSGTGASSPSSAAPTETSLLTVAVTPGANPASSGLAVKADLTAIGGSATQTFYDDGTTGGDLTAGDGTFSYTATVALGTSGGPKSMTATITDGQSRSGSATIPLTVNASTNPSATGTATPSSVGTGSDTLLKVVVTPGTFPASTGIAVTGDLTAIGGSATQQFYDDKTHGDATANDNVFSFQATVPSPTTLGAKSLPITVVDGQARPASATINVTVTLPVIPPGDVVISQVFGAGGNSGAVIKNDFIELYNRTDAAILLDGRSVQYIGSTGTTATPLTGTIQPHSYFLIAESAQGGGTIDLPTPDATGTLAMGGTAGKVALVESTDLLVGTCPSGGQLIDFVGYGNTDCFETRSIGLLTTTTSAMRLLGGCTDTNDNSLDFRVGTPILRNSATPANDCSATPVTPHVVISQIYAGGGNSGATYSNDFIELYNPTASDVNLLGWSLQYTSSTGNTWGSNVQPLGGTIGAGEYFLIRGAAGATPALDVSSPRIDGNINMSASTGKLALVKKVEGLTGNCPVDDPMMVDFIGYGTADCFEGGQTAPNPGNNATALIRPANADTDENTVDFVKLAPNPRGSGTLVDLPPFLTAKDPVGADAPLDASVTINFSEPVTVSGSWYNINCVTSGVHSSAEVAVAFAGAAYVITPNVAFVPGETCTVDVYGSLITDLSGAALKMPVDVEWTFTVTSPSPIETADVHLAMGNPSNASAADPDNYLMKKPEYALSYDRDYGRPNWVSWHLTSDWAGVGTRTDTFRPDPEVLPEWYRVIQFDFSGSGFDRGHMCPSADRNSNTQVNQATFLMSNMVAQAPANNQGPWGDLEGFLRTQLTTQDLYIVSGPLGIGGTGSNGGTTTWLANNHVAVPAETWKVVLFVPKGTNTVTAASHTLAVRMPNVQSINTDWHTYITTVDDVEQATGYNFFSNVPDAVQNAIEAGTDGVNPPGAGNQSVTSVEDGSTAITLDGAAPSGTLTYTIATSPAHGELTGTGGANFTYTPAPDYYGADSFTFFVNNGTQNSNTATVSINVSEVNDPMTATNDSKSMTAGGSLSFPGADLTANDSAGPSNESDQTLTVTSVSVTADTHGSMSLDNGTVTYTPDVSYSGSASFTYHVCDNGTTAGVSAPQCADATVTVLISCPVVTVEASNSGPSCAGTPVTLFATTPNSGVTFAWSGPNSFASTLQSPSVTVAGEYTVIVTAAGGCTESSSTTVAFTSAPAINVQPADVTTAPGSTATFTVTATGHDLHYQWLRHRGNGTPDVVGTDSRTFSVKATAHETYSVRVTNGCGSVESREAVLTANSKPRIGH